MANQKAISAIIAAAWLASFTATFASPAHAQDTGIVLFTEDEQIPLKTYAEFMGSGVLRFTHGSIKDIPTVDSIRFIRCARTGWQPVGVMAASEELFTDEKAERRLLKIATRPVGVTAVAARVADLESPERVAELHRAIRQPEGGDKAYFFLIFTSGQVTQYYPFRMRTAAKQ
jgi:hypothetical protein